MSKFFMHMSCQFKIGGVLFMLLFASMSFAAEHGKAEHKKGHWSLEEDQKLIRYVNAGLGKNKKIKINQVLKNCSISGRSKKQIHERWKQHLDPAINQEKFSNEEIETLLALHDKFGSCWAEIKQNFPRKNGLFRTENQLKNKYNSLKNRRTEKGQSGLKRQIKIEKVSQSSPKKPKLALPMRIKDDEINVPTNPSQIKCPHCHFQFDANDVHETLKPLPAISDLIKSLSQ